MVVYAIVSPLLAALCDSTGNSRSMYMFPIMVVCVACAGFLPLPAAIQHAGQFKGFMEIYGFPGKPFEPTYFFIGTWPSILVVIVWALFIGPKYCPKEPIPPIETRQIKATQTKSELSPLVDRLGTIVFFVTIFALIFSSQIGFPTWYIALVGSLLMVLFRVVDQKNALRDIPWGMLMLYVAHWDLEMH